MKKGILQFDAEDVADLLALPEDVGIRDIQQTGNVIKVKLHGEDSSSLPEVDEGEKIPVVTHDSLFP